MANLFEVEELEERVEFGKWSASVEGGYTEKDGSYVKAGVTYTF
jgi:hypothetical protein